MLCLAGDQTVKCEYSQYSLRSLGNKLHHTALIQTCDEITDETSNIPSTFDINKHKKFFRINSALRVQSELEADPPLDTGVSLLFLIRIRALVSSRASCVPFSSVFATFRAIVFVFKLLWNLLRIVFFFSAV